MSCTDEHPRSEASAAGRRVPGRITFVVPTKDSARTLAACLASVRAQSHHDVELVVVDNGSTDGTPEIAGEWADVVEHWGPERSAQRNRGATLATGELVAFIDSDMVLEMDVAADAVAAFRRDPGLGGLVIPEHAFGEGWWARCRTLEKQLYLGDANVEAARIFRTSVVSAVGGYDEQLHAMEDWDLADRVASAGHRIGRTTAVVWHDEGRVQPLRAFAKKRYYGRGSAGYVARSNGARRSLVRQGPIRRGHLLLRSPVRGAGLVALKALEASGLAIGLWEGRRAAR